MGIEERSSDEQTQATLRNQKGIFLVIAGFCVVIVTIAADATGPVTACHCWSALISPEFVINTFGHIGSAIMIFLGGKKMDW